MHRAAPRQKGRRERVASTRGSHRRTARERASVPVRRRNSTFEARLVSKPGHAWFEGGNVGRDREQVRAQHGVVAVGLLFIRGRDVVSGRFGRGRFIV